MDSIILIKKTYADFGPFGMKHDSYLTYLYIHEHMVSGSRYKIKIWYRSDKTFGYIKCLSRMHSTWPLVIGFCLHCWPRMRNNLSLGHKLCIFVWLVQFYVFLKYQVLFKVLLGKFMVESKYAEFGIVIYSWSAEPRNWQNHVNYILAINASLPRCYVSSFVW